MNDAQADSETSSPSRRTPTLLEVAQRAGVSKTTASRALSGSSTRVDPNTAARVKQAAKALRYIPNPHARALARATSPSVGLLIHEISNPFFSEIASGVLAAAEHHDRMVMICNTRRDPEQELGYISEMRALRVDAILVAGSEFTDETYGSRLEDELAEYRNIGGRVVLMRHHSSGTVVIPDTRSGARQVAHHLLGLGHTDIGVLKGPSQLATVQERLEAFEERLEEDGLSPVGVVEGDFSREGGYTAAKELFHIQPGATAVFALNDLMAAGAVHAVHDLGMQIPEDVSIAGFNDLPTASDISPPLTTVRLPLREMGERALDIALGDDEQPTEPVILDVELVERASTGPAAK